MSDTVQLQVAVVLRDEKARVLLQGHPSGRTWLLPFTVFQPGASVLESAQHLVAEELGSSWRYEELLGLYSERYTVQVGAMQRLPLLLIAVSGIITDTAPQLETIGRRFFSLRELPAIAERAHLDALTDYFAGRHGVLR